MLLHQILTLRFLVVRGRQSLCFAQGANERKAARATYRVPASGGRRPGRMLQHVLHESRLCRSSGGAMEVMGEALKSVRSVLDIAEV